MLRFLSSAWYWFNIGWVRVLLFFVSSADIKGQKNVPLNGPLIIACAHQNNADPPVITGAMPRRVSWLTKAEWFKTPGVGLAFRMARMIPVRRAEADIGALRQAQQLLKEGGCLGMFPEGTRSHGKGLQEGEPGSALVALRSGAPIVPVAIWGTENLNLPRDIIGRTRVHVRFGKSFILTPASKKITREDVAAGTETIMRQIAALLPQRFRGRWGEPEKNSGAKLEVESRTPPGNRSV